MEGALAVLALVAASGAAAPIATPPKATLGVHVSTSANAPGSRMLRLSLAGAGVEEIAFEGSPFLTGDGIASADPAVAPGGVGEVRLVLTPDGARALADASSRSVGKRFGIVVDGRLVAAPIVMAPLRDGVLVVAGMSLAEAQALAPRLGPPSLAVRVTREGLPAAGVLAALEGTWIVKGATLNGEVVPDRKLSGGTWRFRNGTLDATNGAGETGRFTLATEAASPSAFRLDPVPPSPEKPVWMLFLRETTRLRLAYFDGLSKIPSDFSAEKKKVVVELELSR